MLNESHIRAVLIFLSSSELELRLGKTFTSKSIGLSWESKITSNP